eukprot:2157901-Alexandrium_andersonii.AAC.1
MGHARRLPAHLAQDHLRASVVWAGAKMEILGEGVCVTIPEKKLQEVLGEVAQFVRSGRVARKGA